MNLRMLTGQARQTLVEYIQYDVSGTKRRHELQVLVDKYAQAARKEICAVEAELWQYTHAPKQKQGNSLQAPIAMRLHCPMCNTLHIDEGEFATKEHHTHACQHCGHVWRPAIVPTVGVRFLPGFKNEVKPTIGTRCYGTWAGGRHDCGLLAGHVGECGLVPIPVTLSQCKNAGCDYEWCIGTQASPGCQAKVIVP